MTAERAFAYGQVMALLNELGPGTLWPSEQDRIRAAADSLVLCDDPRGDEAVSAIADVETLGRSLAEADRWSKARAGELVWAVLACGPRELILPVAA
jgi:hypothetical protein